MSVGPTEGDVKFILFKRRLPNGAIGMVIARGDVAGDASGGSAQATFTPGAPARSMAIWPQAFACKSVGNIGNCYFQQTSGYLVGAGHQHYQAAAAALMGDASYIASSGNYMTGPIAMGEAGQTTIFYITSTNPGAGNTLLSVWWGWLFDRTTLLQGFPNSIPPWDVEVVQPKLGAPVP